LADLPDLDALVAETATAPAAEPTAEGYAAALENGQMEMAGVVAETSAEPAEAEAQATLGADGDVTAPTMVEEPAGPDTAATEAPADESGEDPQNA
jgi:hypothetical protein